MTSPIPFLPNAILEAFQEGSNRATLALSKWLNIPVSVKVEFLGMRRLAQIVEEFPIKGEPLGCAWLDFSGGISGRIALLFEDTSGLMLGNLIAGKGPGPALAWGPWEESAVKETANILGCAFLGRLAAMLSTSVIPTPPTFLRDFPESILLSLLSENITEGDEVLRAQTLFRAKDASITWSLLILPAPAFRHLLFPCKGVS